MRFAWTVLTACLTLGAQPSDEGFVRWASRHAIPLKNDDLRVLKPVIGNARIIAFGELTHGAHEPLAFRNRLIQFLVKEHNVRVLAFESGFTESIDVEAYIQGASKDPVAVAPHVFSWDTEPLADNLALIQWLRNYNQQAPPSERVHFYGFDITGGRNGDVVKLDLAVDQALQLLASPDPAAAQRMKERLAPVVHFLSVRHFAKASEQQRAEVLALLNDTSRRLTTLRHRILPKVSTWEFDRTVHGLEVARQIFTEVLPRTGKPYAEMGPMVTARDRISFNNVRWIMDRSPSKHRAFLFAHNNHLMNSVFNDFKLNPPAQMLGTSLRPHFQNGLVVIGSASRTAAKALAAKTIGSIDQALHKVAKPPFVVDFRAARSDAAAWSWLNAPQTATYHYGDNPTLVPATAFDAFLLFDGITEASYVKK